MLALRLIPSYPTFPGTTEGTKSLTHRLRSWFLRGVLEALERQHGSAALTLLAEKVPRRLLPHASLDRLRASAALDTILLDDGEELLLLIDSLLGDTGGRVLEGVGQELASRALGQGGVAKYGDLHGTVARLQAFLDHPFVDTPTLFELKRTDLGFSLTVGVVGRPRATRVLRHLAVGAVAAADRSARQGGGIKLSSEIMADRASLNVTYQRTVPPAARFDSDLPPASVRRSTQSFRPPSLSEEVERILSSHRSSPAYVPRSAPAASSSVPPAAERSPQSERPSTVQPVASRSPGSERHSEVQRVAPATSGGERTSEVQPVAPRSPPRVAGEPPPALPGSRKSNKG